VKAGTDAATKNYEQAIAMTKDQVEKASTALFRGYDEMTVLNKDNVEAVVASSTIVAKGYETIGREVMSFTQSAIETNIAATKAIFGAKTLRELVDLQADFARSQFDNALAESAKLTEMSVRVANDAIEPLQSRVNVTVEKLLKPVAA
jgi:phasin family protein